MSESIEKGSSFGRGEILTAAAFLGLITSVNAAGPDAGAIESIKTDYSAFNQMFDTIPSTHKHLEQRKNTNPEFNKDVVLSEKKDTIREGNFTYTAVVNYENSTPIQYRFSVIDGGKGYQIETIDGGNSIIVEPHPKSHEVDDTLSNGTVQKHTVYESQASAHIDVTHPKGTPDHVVMSFKNGGRVYLEKGKNGQWKVTGEDKIQTNFTEEGIQKIVNRALDSHTMVRLKFEKKKTGGVSYSGIERASNQ